jgi:hypothetical protein
VVDEQGVVKGSKRGRAQRRGEEGGGDRLRVDVGWGYCKS